MVGKETVSERKISISSKFRYEQFEIKSCFERSHGILQTQSNYKKISMRQK
jgi:hypothetical protein